MRTKKENDSYGFSRIIADNYIEGFRRLAFDVIDRELAEIAQLDGEALRRFDLIFSHSGWVYRLMCPRPGGAVSLPAAFDKPTIMLVADPPFYTWLDQNLLSPHDKRFAYHIDPEFVAMAQRLGSSGRHQTYLPCRLETGHLTPLPTREKDIPLLVAATFRDVASLREPFAARPPHHLGILDELVEAATDQHDRQFIEVAQAVFIQHGLACDMALPDIKALLICADQIVRTRRRLMMLSALRDVPMCLVTNRPPPFDLHPRSTVRISVPFDETLGLLRRARATAICQPNYAGALNERIVFAMQARTVVLSTSNNLTMEHFGDGHDLHYFTPDFSNARDVLQQTMTVAHAETLRDSAQAKIEAGYSALDNIRRFLQPIQAAGLLA
ncbi:MAG: hypothetical protein HQL38_04740 [Alphaproteobacteria bacterium]|nr:hypothetical protein [Alphaproteobacteria bacterium]